ncbi:MAG TPA: cell division protein FtsA, partial [candidate division Zixibacteria bacterium]|nr:cell division protein FtsA [candidate division Zixibacteria bacterium]
MTKINNIAGLDIGSSKIAVAVGRLDDDGNLRLLGIGKSPAEGIKRGMVVDLEKVVSSIHSAIDDAELVSGCKIS